MTTDHAGKNIQHRRYRGPVRLQGSSMRETSTTDERLLANADRADWLHTDPWLYNCFLPVDAGLTTPDEADRAWANGADVLIADLAAAWQSTGQGMPRPGAIVAPAR